MKSLASTVKKICLHAVQGDLRYFIYEKTSLFVGWLCICLNCWLYRKRLSISCPYKVWGGIRFLIFGRGSISIGKNFHAVSDRRRSFLTLFSPCHLTVIGDGHILLGEHVGLNGTTIAARGTISIGANTMIGPNTIIVDHDGHPAWPPEARWSTGGAIADIKIEEDVWIGMNCLILKGVKIGKGSVIAAGSVVISDVEPACLYAGNPAKKIRSFEG